MEVETLLLSNLGPFTSPELRLTTTFPSGIGSLTSVDAAVKLQKAYRGYRTRRRLADSAVVAEELWWQAIDYARLNHSTISFFDLPETVSSRWNRVSLIASKVGQGLSMDAQAQKLAFQHWIEAIDPRHRYGHSLHLYYDVWCTANSGQPFFYWLDVGDGKDLDLEECPKSKLRKQCIKYLGHQEREDYEYIIVGLIVHNLTGDLFNTRKPEGAKWIFVMSTCKKLYAGVKKKGKFHHSSFLAGGATLAAGRLVVDNGVLKSISAYSGHYRPTEERLNSFLSFLKENDVNLDEVEIEKPDEDNMNYDDNKVDSNITETEPPISNPPHQHNSLKTKDGKGDSTPPNEGEGRNEYKRTLSGGLQSSITVVPKEAILQRINSRKSNTYELGHQLSRSWSTGVGPRIGCIVDYPLELRSQALEFTELSPRRSRAASIFCKHSGFVSSPLLSPSA